MKETSLSELIKPSQKQRLALGMLDQYKYVFYGGAKYGGKSYFLRWALIKLLLKWASNGHRNVRVGLFCEDYPSLKDRQITKIKREFPSWLGRLQDNSIEGLSFILKNEFGGGILAMRNLDDPSKYSSAEFAAIGVDEITRNEESVFTELRSIMRWPGIPDTRFIAVGMPGGIGHGWVKRYWIDRDFPENESERDQFCFVPAKAMDNAHISESYLNQLKALPEKLRKAYLEGNWDIFEGQYFMEWDRDRHVVHPFAIPESWKRFRAYDHGRENPACCKWYALDQDGRVWVYRELYVRGMNVDEIAKEINRLSEGEKYEYSVADPSIFANIGFTDKFGGQTIAETFARNNVMFMPASNRRVDGWSLMHQYLNWKEGRPAMMLYFNTCFNSIRTIPSLIHDDKKPEDLDTKSEDHAADCDRYFLMSLHERKTVTPLTETEKKLRGIFDQSFTQNINNLYYGS